jgi:hypothetical protein
MIQKTGAMCFHGRDRKIVIPINNLFASKKFLLK